MGGKLLDIGLGDFLDLIPKQRQQKQYKPMRLHQTKNFCRAEETINKMKRPPTKWEKIFADHMYDKGLISKIYKKSI